MGDTAPLTGRDDELSALLAVVDLGRPTSARAAIVIAEAGAGKTRLLDEALARAAAPPAQVVRVRGGELTATLPFAPLRRGLRRAVGDDARTERLLAVLRDEREDTTRALVIDAMTDSIERLALEGPVLLMLDDAHWLDDATLTVIDLLARQIDSTALRMVVAARPHPRTPALDAVLRTLARGPTTRSIDLEALPASQAQRITEAVIGGPATDRVHQLVGRAGGNPLYCTELGIALRDRVTPGEDGRLDLAVSDDEIELDVIQLNLSTLDDPVRALLRDAAVLGTTWDPRVLALLTERSAPVVLEQLRPAFASGVLAETDDGQVEFRHDLVRDAVLAGLPGAVASRRHRDVVRAMSAAGMSAEHWAPHVRRADWTGDSEAWDWFVRGAAGTASLDAAAALLDHARRTLAGEPPMPFLSLQLERLLETDQLPELRMLLQDILGRDPEGLRGTEGLDILALRVFHARWWTMGAHRDINAGPWLDRLATVAGPGARDVATMDRCGRDLIAGHEPAALRDDMLRIARAARAREDTRLAVTAVNTAVNWGLLHDRPDLASTLLVEVMREQLATDTYAWIMVDNLFVASLLDTANGASAALFDEVAAVAERLGPPSSTTMALLHVERLVRRGEWSAAVSLVDDIRADDRGVNLPRPTRASVPVRVYAGAGRHADADHLLTNGALLDPLTSTLRERALDDGLHHRDHALAALLRGDDPTRHVGRAFDAWSQLPGGLATRFDPTTWAAIACLAGVPERAGELLDRVTDQAILPTWDRNVLQQLTGHPQGDARSLVDVALERHDFAVVEALAATLDDDAAVGALSEGHTAARSAGAAAWEARLAEALARRGGTTAPLETRPVTGADALTPAEVRVLPLILDGLLYREIADELHNSRRTIESHAASIMRKLGVSSRRELPEVVDEIDLRELRAHGGAR